MESQIKGKETIYQQKLQQVEETYQVEKSTLTERIAKLQREKEDLVKLDRQNQRNKTSFDELEKISQSKCLNCHSALL